MKKIAFLMSVASLGLLVACGPSAEEKALKDKAAADSAKAAEEKLKREQDSIANVKTLDSLKLKAYNDSVALASQKPAAGGSKSSGTKAPVKTQDQKNIETISNLKGDNGTKTPEQKKKDEQNLNTIKNLKGGK